MVVRKGRLSGKVCRLILSVDNQASVTDVAT